MATITLTNEQRLKRGKATHAGTVAVNTAHRFAKAETRYQHLSEKRAEILDTNPGGNVPFGVLMLLGLILLTIASYYLGIEVWGELFKTSDSAGNASSNIAGYVGMALSFCLVVASVIHHSHRTDYDMSGFKTTNSFSVWFIVILAVVRLGLGAATWYFYNLSMVSVNAITPIDYTPLAFVAADFVLMVFEYVLSRLFGNYGLPHLTLFWLGLGMWFSGNAMSSKARKAYENHLQQTIYTGLYNNSLTENQQALRMEFQGSPLLQSAINYHLQRDSEGKQPTVPKEPPTVQSGIGEAIEEDMVADVNNDGLREYMAEQNAARLDAIFD